MHAYEWRNGELVAEEKHRLTFRLYFRNELVLMLERAGFRDVSLRGGYDDAPPTPEHRFLVFVAKRQV